MTRVEELLDALSRHALRSPEAWARAAVADLSRAELVTLVEGLEGIDATNLDVAGCLRALVQYSDAVTPELIDAVARVAPRSLFHVGRSVEGADQGAALVAHVHEACVRIVEAEVRRHHRGEPVDTDRVDDATTVLVDLLPYRDQPMITPDRGHRLVDACHALDEVDPAEGRHHGPGEMVAAALLADWTLGEEVARALWADDPDPERRHRRARDLARYTDPGADLVLAFWDEHGESIALAIADRELNDDLLTHPVLFDRLRRVEHARVQAAVLRVAEGEAFREAFGRLVALADDEPLLRVLSELDRPLAELLEREDLAPLLARNDDALRAFAFELLRRLAAEAGRTGPDGRPEPSGRRR